VSQYTTSLGVRIFRKLLMATVFIAPALASAQQDCGTITKSVRLQSDCIGPLVVGANNVTVDLNGHTVFAGPEFDDARGSVEVFNKRKVTVKNGIVRGSSIGIYVTGGQYNKFSNLVVSTVFEGGTFAWFENVKNATLSRLSIRAYEDTTAFRFRGDKSTLSRLSVASVNGAPLARIGGKHVTISKSTFSGGYTGTCSPTFLFISDSTVAGNIFTGGAGGPTSGLCLQGDRNRVKHNSISSRLGSGLTLIGGKHNTFFHNTVTAEQENPPAIVDIDGGADACQNRWCNNRFSTDSEGDGSRQGCIR
jgi:hypothetical protein